MKIIVNGVKGRMGCEVARFLSEGFRGAEMIAGVDIHPEGAERYPVFEKLADYSGEADCVIDFSHYLATEELLDYCIARNLPVVIATTGHTETELAKIRDASGKIPVFHSANMSLGIALLASLARTAAKTMPDANIEIVEKHHNRKLDVPSGTALLIAEEIRQERADHQLLVGRHDNGRRPEKEIGIHSLRLGNIVGEHEVILATDSQVITLKHEAQSRRLFAEGAVEAAGFLCGKGPGLYTMKDLVSG